MVWLHLYTALAFTDIGAHNKIDDTLHFVTSGVVYFLLKYLVDRYNIYYVYRPESFNGRQFLHRSALKLVIVGAVHLQLSTLFFSIVRLGKFNTDKLILMLRQAWASPTLASCWLQSCVFACLLACAVWPLNEMFHFVGGIETFLQQHHVSIHYN